MSDTAWAIDGIEGVRAIAWDFDGVLNTARHAWQEALRAELGLDPAALIDAVFRPDRRALLCGESDILDRLEAWIAAQDTDAAAEDVLEILLEHDNRPDGTLLQMMAQLDRAGVTQVIATNSDARRARYLAGEGGWLERVDALFASGEMGAMKPDAAYFEQIETALGLKPQDLLLIDDVAANTDAADRRGWRTFDYTGDAMALAKALMPLMLRGASDAV